MKKLTALLLALVMTFGMVACGSKTNDTTTTPSTGDTSSTDTTDTGDAGDTSTEDTGSGEKLYIPVMAKGFQHAYWQAVKQGADQAAEELGVEIYFAGPASETNIDEQVNMVKTELAKNPKAMALAALSTDSVTEILAECAEKNIPVIGFDSGVPGDTTGAVKATAATDNEAAAAIAAEKFGENETVVAAMQNATSDAPIVIGCLSQDAVSASVTGRTTGAPVRVLKNKMAKEYIRMEKENIPLAEREKLTLGSLRRAVFEGDTEMGSLMAGQVAGQLHEIRPVRAILEELYADYQSCVKGMVNDL